MRYSVLAKRKFKKTIDLGGKNGMAKKDHNAVMMMRVVSRIIDGN